MYNMANLSASETMTKSKMRQTLSHKFVDLAMCLLTASSDAERGFFELKMFV
jgi:hypothetical protein